MKIEPVKRSLEDVTRELLTLQSVSNALISTSYLDDVLKIIVEGIEEGLNYDAGILFILDHSSKSLYPHITHRNDFVQFFEKELKCIFSSINLSEDSVNNLLVQSAQQRKILISEQISEIFFDAPINMPADLGDHLKENMGINNFIVVPMVIRDEVAGVILCATSRTEVTESDTKSLQNFANQAGLALDNAQMMNSLKATQGELSRQNSLLNTAFSDLKGLEKLKNGLIGMVVHDMKNPLTSVRGYLELILEIVNENTENENILKFIRKAYDSSEDLLKMIHNLLDISRMEEGKFTLNRAMCLIGDLVNSVYDQLNVVAENNQRSMSIELHENTEPVPIDFDIAHRVLSNLVINAIKHTRKGGKILIRVSIDDQKKTTICVEDDGEGIPQEYLDCIFEKFAQVKGKNYQNTHNVGLGLTFCKMAVEAHSGNIWVESELGKGSKFIFDLPFIKSEELND